MPAASTRNALSGLLLIMSALASVARAELPADPAAVTPLPVGAPAPDFTVHRADGTPYVFNSRHLVAPHIVIFYRGGWCPYCNAQLADLRLVEPKLRASGFVILFVSTDRPELLYSSLKAADIHYTLLSDGQLLAAKAFHIAYHLDEAAYARQLKFGVDLEATTGSSEHALPVPSVFVIDTSGVIRFEYSNPDYKVRLGADELWKAAAPFARVSGRSLR